MFSKEKMDKCLSQESILAYFLALVVIWFGYGEIFNTIAWVGFAPEFLGTGKLVYTLVVTHGIVLSAIGLMLAFNFHRRVAAAVLTLMLAHIVVGLIVAKIPADLVIRDVGLLGMAFALAIGKRQQ